MYKPTNQIVNKKNYQYCGLYWLNLNTLVSYKKKYIYLYIYIGKIQKKEIKTEKKKNVMI